MKRGHFSTACLWGCVIGYALCVVAVAAPPDHPIITEAYTDPNGGLDGPVGRDPANLHQEYIEIYLPPASDLDPSIDKDSLELTIYAVEGDSSSSGLGLVNYRFDLPTFDLDPSNGITDGAIERPASGIVVLGWVDYVGDPPTELRGTPNTRIALINGGITDSPAGALFIAINGYHFGGTDNFPILVAESLIHLPNEARSGVIQNGSEILLLVDREDPGYVELYDDKDTAHVPPIENADPDLPSGSVLQTSAMFDGFAGNDDPNFDVIDQPYEPPTGDDIDLETVLPLGGAFSLLVPQIPEKDIRPMRGVGNGYARIYLDVAKTTESPSEDDPVADAMNAYRRIRNVGPFFATPGRAPLTTSPPELSVAVDSEQMFDVLAQTTGRPGVMSANVGGAFGIDISVSAGQSGDPEIATFAAGDSAANVGGQTLGFPTVAITPGGGANHGDVTVAEVTVTAVNSSQNDPPVENAVQLRTVTARVLRPTTGVDENGAPLQATVFVALQAVPADPNVANELLGTDLGTFLVDQFGKLAQDSLDQGLILIDPATNIHDPLVMQPMIEDFPEIPSDYINLPGAEGTLDLVETVLTSAEVRSGARTYDDSINDDQTAVKAIRINTPDTRTFNGVFSPSERVHFADPKGFMADPRSGLHNATTSRTFEMVLIDTNVRDSGELETGATDDFGIVVEVAETEPDSPVVVGEFVFLSFSGGLQGADIDTLQVPPGEIVANLIYLDLDNLHEVLGIRSIESIIFIDGSGSGEVDIVEVFSLNPSAVTVPFDDDGDGDVDEFDYAAFLSCVTGPGGPMAPGCETHDGDNDLDVDFGDYSLFQLAYTGSL